MSEHEKQSLVQNEENRDGYGANSETEVKVVSVKDEEVLTLSSHSLSGEDKAATVQVRKSSASVPEPRDVDVTLLAPKPTPPPPEDLEAGTTRGGNNDKDSLSKKSKCILGFTYVILVVSLMLSMARWGCLTTLTITYINATLTPGNNGLLDSQLLAMGNLVAQSCRALQFIALIYGVAKFSKVLSSKSGCTVLRNAAKNFCFTANPNEPTPCTVYTCILVGILVLYLAATIPPPVLLSTWFSELAQWHDDDMNQQRSSVGYTVLAWFHHISDLTIRLGMGVATRLIMVAWVAAGEELRNIKNLKVSNTKDKFSRLVRNYKETGRTVARLEDIFQEWFVMTWVVYFIGVTGNTTLVLKALFTGLFGTASRRSWLYFAHLINDIAAFAIIYICGGLMNYSHQKYRDTLEDVQEGILSDSENLSDFLHQRADLIPTNPNFKFIPSLCCLSIPLESAGFSFTLILTGFAFLLSFITAFTEV